MPGQNRNIKSRERRREKGDYRYVIYTTDFESLVYIRNSALRSYYSYWSVKVGTCHAFRCGKACRRNMVNFDNLYYIFCRNV